MTGIVLARLQGGLGNQLFQVAAARTVAERNVLSCVFEFDQNQIDDLQFLLKDSIGPVDSGDLGSLTFRRDLPYIRSRFQRLRRELLVHSGSLKILRQTPHQANDEFAVDFWSSKAKKVALEGYFQHPTWFEGPLNEITRNAWQSLDGLVANDDVEQFVVISFRRGDYVRIGCDLPMSYYESALENLGRTDLPVYLVGDDSIFLNLMREKLRRDGLDVRETNIPGLSQVLQDLFLLSRATHTIMSNSTFCWWGTVIGDLNIKNHDRRVLTPSEWLPTNNSKCLIRSTWECIDVN